MYVVTVISYKATQIYSDSDLKLKKKIEEICMHMENRWLVRDWVIYDEYKVIDSKGYYF